MHVYCFHGTLLLLCMLKQVGHSAVHAFREALIEFVCLEIFDQDAQLMYLA